MSLTRTLVLLIFLWTGSALAHGDIESIECQDQAKKISLNGKPVGKKGHFSMQVLQKDKVVRSIASVKIQLEDIIVDKQIVEKITIPMEGEGQATLNIPEDYSLEKRPGPGSLKLTSPELLADLQCTVTY